MYTRAGFPRKNQRMEGTVIIFFSFVISAVPLLHRLISTERTAMNMSSRFAFECKDAHDHCPIKGNSTHTHTHTWCEMRYTKCRWHLVWVLVCDSTVWVYICFKILCSGHCLCRKTKHLIWVDESTGFWKIVTWWNFTWTITFHFLILWVHCL